MHLQGGEFFFFINAENMFVFFCIKPIFVNWVNVELISRFKKNQSNTSILTDSTDYIYYFLLQWKNNQLPKLEQHNEAKGIYKYSKYNSQSLKKVYWLK